VTRQRESGFTLLEVLVALAILAISLGVLIPVFAGTLDREAALADQKTAAMLAQSKLDTVGSEIPLADGVSDGTFSNGFSWHIEIAPYKFEYTSRLVTPMLVTLTVKWPAKNGSRSLTLKTIRLIGHD
jgi:general secretion pathway protein I